MVGIGTENGREDDSLPLDIMINILKRVPVKSLIQFKSVSKKWKKIIETPHFTSEHRSHSASNNAFLLLHRIPYYQTSSFCLIDPDFKVHNLQSLDFTSPTVQMVGVCNGLVLIKDVHDHKKLSLWNPATTQVKEVTETLIGFNHFPPVMGFGFCPIVNDYKIVRISIGRFGLEAGTIINFDDLRVNRAEVYSLTNGCWREINVVNLQNVYPKSRPVTANGAIYWLANMNPRSDSNPELVVSFDIEHEVFTLLKGPPIPPSSPLSCNSSKLAVYNNKLAMFRHFINGNFESRGIDLWVMEDANACGAGKDWIRKCSVERSSRMLYDPLCIWRDEIVCREQCTRENEFSEVKAVLSLFNPCRNESKNMPVQINEFCYAAFNYADSLVSVHNIHHEL